MVAFPKKTGNERREGRFGTIPRPYPRAVLRGAQGPDQGTFSGSCWRTRHLPGRTPHQGQRLLHPRPPHPLRPHRAFRSDPFALCLGGEHPEDLPVLGSGVRGVLLAPEHLPPGGGSYRGGRVMEEPAAMLRVLRRLSRLHLPLGTSGQSR